MILYISRTLGGHNGAAQSGIDVLVALLEAGYVTTVCSESHTHAAKELKRFTGKTPIWLDFSGRKAFSRKINLSLPKNFIKYLIQKRQHHQKISKIKVNLPKLCIVNSIGGHELWTRLKKDMPPSIRSSIIIRESPRHFGGCNPRSLNYAIQAVQEYDNVIFVSSNCMNEWAKIADLDDKRLFYIPNCCREDLVEDVHCQKRQVLRDKVNYSAGSPIAVCIASLQPRKGQDILVDAFPKLLSFIPDLKLYLVGPMVFDNSWGEQLLQRISGMGLSEHIQYLGSTDQPLEYIYAADVLLLPSRAEAMPRVILESMAVGTPVIASDIDGIPELVDHKETGLLFSPENSEELITAFNFFAQNPEAVRRMASNAQKKYWSHFSRAQQVQRYEKAVRQLLNNSDEAEPSGLPRAEKTGLKKR